LAKGYINAYNNDERHVLISTAYAANVLWYTRMAAQTDGNATGK